MSSFLNIALSISKDALWSVGAPDTIIDENNIPNNDRNDSDRQYHEFIDAFKRSEDISELDLNC